MNLLLLFPADFYEKTRVRLNGRRVVHLQKILKAVPGSILKAGLINGSIGKAIVLAIDSNTAELEVNLEQQAPPALPVTVILALPRPKVLRRVIRNITVLGVKHIHLINSWRVEKSYWQTPWLENSAIEEQLLLGLEQGSDTRLPQVLIKKRFKPFVEDELGHIIANTQPLVAHPSGGLPCPMGLNKPTTLAIGPEGGFIDYEVEKLEEVGFQSITLGNRILRVETAIPVLLSKLFS
jgi:RsmE family RNA methyltransferase